MIDIKNPIKGEMNGYKFSVKPKSLLARKIDKELREDLREWQEANNADFMKWLEDNKDVVENATANDLDVWKDAPESKEWLEDVEFRSTRFKKMADACMEFQKNPPKSLWESDEIEYGMIEMAWDFFTGKRQMPRDMFLG